MTCIYCLGHRAGERKTLEHIWPKALGGDYAPSQFRTMDVGERCNNLAGLWVDGGFLKSAFITHERAIAARRFVDLRRPGILPLIYLGIDQGFPSQPGEVCERWRGPAGEHFYHVHAADNDNWFGYAGGDLLRRKRKDVSRAYLGLTTTHPYWLSTAIQSFIAYFGPARLFLTTIWDGMPVQLEKWIMREVLATPIEAAEIEWIRNQPARLQARMPLRIDFADRFMAKLALGLGHTIIGSEYHTSRYADELRKILWSRSPSERDDSKVLGSGYWQAREFADLSEIIGLPGAWTISITAVDDGLVASVCTPLGRLMNVVISDDISPLSHSIREMYHMGVLYFAVPQLKTFIGPVELPKYLAHRTGSRVLPELAALEAMRVDESTMPPRNGEAL